MTENEWLNSTDPAAMLAYIMLADNTVTAFPGLKTRKELRSDRKLRLFAVACCRSVWHLLADEWSRKAVEVAERYSDDEVPWHEAIRVRELLPTARDADFVGSGAQLVINCLMPPTFQQWVPLGELLNNAVRPCGSCRGAGRVTAYPEAFDDPPPASIICRDCHGAGVLCVVGSGALPYAAQAAILRDIVGNPWRRPVRYEAAVRRPGGPGLRPGEWEWDDEGLTPTVVAMAQTAYDERPEVPCRACNATGFSWGSEGRCLACHGTGTLADGRLDPEQLLVLADALEEAGCPMEVKETCRGCGGAGVIEDEVGSTYACVVCSPGGNWAGTGKQNVPHPLLAHLRSPGPHWRGCWALDLILGKE